MLSDKLEYEKYKFYSAEEFLQDDFFIQSMIHPSDDSVLFWNEAIAQDIIDKEEYAVAHLFICSSQEKRERITQEEMFDLWEDIELRNKDFLKKKEQRLNIYYSISAVIAVLLACGFLFFQPIFFPLDLRSAIEHIDVVDSTSSDIKLILADNKTLSLVGQEADILYNEKGIEINNQETDIKNTQLTSRGAIAYNQLVVPVGKRSMLTLTDGSKIWVNSGTRVVYPVFFDKKKREVFVDGEIFLDVYPMKRKPFIVKTKDHQLEVLGTSFNLTAYERDTVQNIVLVSGSLKVKSQNKKEIVLSPNEMYTYSNGIRQVKTINVEEYISWRNGIYQYQSEQLGIILTRLSRYYGKEINYTDDVSHLRFSGKLDLKDDLSVILKGIATTAPIAYESRSGKYMISKK
ncbi:FecR family protein [Massilibacteroides vaginae]|uniref:FecR family protein n=1 Tax=Massilibacteroides vaginae TaxID=1673718 RepID=UPI000A1C9249|nr:FecR domain-containing protein [Massilibacteroides vaginae]